MGWFYFSDGLWLARVSLVPCVLAALALSFFAQRTRRSRMTALLVAFFAVAFAGSFGAVAVESAQRGIARVNVSGYLVWCWVYAAIFLPLSYPLTRLLQHAIQRLSSSTGNA
jgi:cellulose synthase/poly-beta-1,6-N-acetylglucosamine synthase-like glycosyltransferase